jgi:hypothetical protein
VAALGSAVVTSALIVTDAKAHRGARIIRVLLAERIRANRRRASYASAVSFVSCVLRIPVPPPT